ncbi:MAG: hypothetical protein JRD93_10710 [Deltaproteobacteria bacterium]|nr:hypothetical protein [Deltaproteobacteria bacterium]
MKGIIDSTLREGEQAAHVYFDLTEKLHIINLLIKVDIDEIELGIAVQNPETRELIKKAGKLAGCPKLALWCRCLPGDIEETLALSPDVIALSIPVSDIHIEHKLGRDRTWVMTRARESILLTNGTGNNPRQVLSKKIDILELDGLIEEAVEAVFEGHSMNYMIRRDVDACNRKCSGVGMGCM